MKAVLKTVCVLICFIMLIKSFGLYDNSYCSLLYKNLKSTSSQQCLHNRFTTERDILVQQRNGISKLLNQKQKVNGQMKCNYLKDTNTSAYQTTEEGGWCPIATKTKHLGFDRSLATTLAHFFKGKTVGSFGDGPGAYKMAILTTGLVKEYDAYDGAPFCEDTSNGSVLFLDLSIPQYGLPVYDWILCLEVAEHIPGEFEAIMIDNINRHAREGVILSWATPGQGGYSHVNNRSPEYVIAEMEKIGFHYDAQETENIRKGAKHRNLKRNINVFLRTVLNNLAVNA
ncbi:uncharacterized protein LOC123559766 isoform X1 [Mercenaria mercenaria]|uniref:uncharacterized protein LOC123559766 isoform X1 n=1 Tax=Mercenaria mercenaria TaxID=6596 RepID=UPI00234F5C9E|nr:uncharacterized protein LOC123559766 isoform X1 [Mercenaria mercenaria]